MIKLIASDLDGTLIQKPARTVPKEVFPAIHDFTEKGGLFVAASGRQYANLKRLFAPVKDEIAYICENGCLVIYKEEVLYHAKMERQMGEEILRAILSIPDCEILLSGVNTCYIQPKDPSYADYMINHVKNNTIVVDDIFQVQEPYFKISVYNKYGIERCEDFFFDTFKEKVNVVTSGNAWLDMMPLHVHKGSALKMLSEKLSIPLSDMMAIGDHYNDMEMLSLVGHPACVENAKPEIKEICKYKTASAEKLIAETV